MSRPASALLCSLRLCLTKLGRSVGAPPWLEHALSYMCCPTLPARVQSGSCPVWFTVYHCFSTAPIRLHRPCHVAFANSTPSLAQHQFCDRLCMFGSGTPSPKAILSRCSRRLRWQLAPPQLFCSGFGRLCFGNAEPCSAQVAAPEALQGEDSPGARGQHEHQEQRSAPLCCGVLDLCSDYFLRCGFWLLSFVVCLVFCGR